MGKVTTRVGTIGMRYMHVFIVSLRIFTVRLHIPFINNIARQEMSRQRYENRKLYVGNNTETREPKSVRTSIL